MRRRRGLSLTELMLSMALLAASMTLALVTWVSLSRTRAAQHKTIDARQEVRKLMSVISNDIEGASFIYAGFDKSVALGTADEHDFSGKPVPLAGKSGNSLVYAIAEPPYEATAMTYTVVALWSEPDPDNEETLRIVMSRFAGVKGPPPKTPGGFSQTPALIDVRGMRYESKTTKIFTPHILPPSDDVADLFSLSDPATSVTIDATFQKQATQGAPTTREHLFTRVTYRIQ